MESHWLRTMYQKDQMESSVLWLSLQIAKDHPLEKKHSPDIQIDLWKIIGLLPQEIIAILMVEPEVKVR